MKRFLLIIVILFFISCDKECSEELGLIVTKEYTVEEFDQVIANIGIELTIIDAAEQKLLVETGENRLDNLHISVTDGVLELQADPACSLRPSLDPVKVIVSTPNLTMIRNSSEYTLKSSGVLNFPNLKIFTENYQSDYTNLGEFDLEVVSENIQIVSNGLARIKIKGTTTNLRLSYHAGIGKFEGRNLIAQNVIVYHKGENKLEVNPQQSLTGNLYATGDLISYHHPETVEVTQHFFGKLIFK
ncbi:MAG TPA: DUF2807 domain-containing protein [Lutibacter sp.]|nr:DUF2807 domain-containing protein [Lutibacter sp.]